MNNSSEEQYKKELQIKEINEKNRKEYCNDLFNLDERYPVSYSDSIFEDIYYLKKHPKHNHS